MLQSITTTICETATVGGATTLTAKTAVKYEKDDKGNKTAVLVDKKRTTLGTIICTSATTATYGFQQQSLNNVLADVQSAQSYVESMSDEELEQALIELDLLEANFETINQKNK